MCVCVYAFDLSQSLWHLLPNSILFYLFFPLSEPTVAKIKTWSLWIWNKFSFFLQFLLCNCLKFSLENYSVKWPIWIGSRQSTRLFVMHIFVQKFAPVWWNSEWKRLQDAERRTLCVFSLLLHRHSIVFWIYIFFFLYCT